MAELTGQPADFQSLRGAARVGRLILPNLQLSKFALHYAVTQDLSWSATIFQIGDFFSPECAARAASNSSQHKSD
jgi:hypothetical protein